MQKFSGAKYHVKVNLPWRCIRLPTYSVDSYFHSQIMYWLFFFHLISLFSSLTKHVITGLFVSACMIKTFHVLWFVIRTYGSCNLPALKTISYFDSVDSFDSAVFLVRSLEILIYLLCDPVSATFSFLLKLESYQHCTLHATMVICFIFLQYELHACIHIK